MRVKAVAWQYRKALEIAGFSEAGDEHMNPPEGITSRQAKTLAWDVWRKTAIQEAEKKWCGCCWRTRVVGWWNP